MSPARWIKANDAQGSTRAPIRGPRRQTSEWPVRTRLRDPRPKPSSVAKRNNNSESWRTDLPKSGKERADYKGEVPWNSRPARPTIPLPNPFIFVSVNSDDRLPPFDETSHSRDQGPRAAGTSTETEYSRHQPINRVIFVEDERGGSTRPDELSDDSEPH